MLFLDAKELIDYHRPKFLVEHWILVVGNQIQHSLCCRHNDRYSTQVDRRQRFWLGWTWRSLVCNGLN